MAIEKETATIKALIGLGNPGNQYHFTRHNIGFRVMDALAEKYGASWKTQKNMMFATITINNHTILLIKPQTFMNSSGLVIPFLAQQNIKPTNIVVVHDELELPFAKLKIKYTGSAKGHNGLKSIIQQAGYDFTRLACGIARPEAKEEVPSYVLQPFNEPAEAIQELINNAVILLENLAQ